MTMNPGSAGNESGRVLTQETGQLLRARQVEVLYDQSPVALAASVSAALLLVGIQWSASEAMLLLSWLVLLLAIVGLRLILLYLFRHADSKAERSAFWLAWFTAGVMASAITWDATIFLIAPGGSEVHVGIAVLWICGLTAGSVAALSAIKSVFFAFSLPALVPGAVFLVLTGSRTEAVIGGAMFLFLAFLSMNALRMHRTVRRSLQLQLENSELIAHLNEEKQRIEKLNDGLERRVVERTAEIAAADAAKSRFLAAASHDLRQPLQTLSLLTAILSKTVQDPQSTRAVHGLRDTVGIMDSLLDALLDVSKLDSGTVTPEVTDFSVADLLERLRLVFSHQAREKNLDLHVVTSSAVVRSDPVLLEHIVRNLLSNGIRYTDSGKVLLGCRRRGGCLRMEVWDTGIGIPEAQINRIFEEFYQLGNPARHRDQGLGLGLAMVDRSARLLGHRIDVRSIEGKGSVFAVTVPLGSVNTRTGRVPSLEAAAGSNHQRASIILVEDDEAVCNATRSLLELYDFRVSTAVNSDDARKNIQSRAVPPDLIIADYRLPSGNTGIELIKDIRDLLDDEVPGIILTGDISSDVVREAQTNRLTLLHKPVDPDELLALINKQLA